MGLFDKRDKKRKDDFDSPVEQVDLAPTPPPREPSTAAAKAPASTSASATASAPAATASTAAPATTTASAAAAPAAAAAPPPRAAAPPPQARAPQDTDDYGIEKAIELMRTLPSENVELVVQVVKFSLESVGIKLPTIIEDATRRQKDIQGKISVRRSEIADLEQEIKVRKEEIEGLEEDHRETTMVRERLELAEQIGKKKPDGGAATVASATGTPSGSIKAESVKDDGGSTRKSSPTTPPPTLAPLTPAKK